MRHNLTETKRHVTIIGILNIATNEGLEQRTSAYVIQKFSA